jgi:hypothetical protein
LDASSVQGQQQKKKDTRGRQGHIPQNTDPNPLLRSRASASAQKSFGETFGAATGVSDPRLQKSAYETTSQAAKPPL